MANDGRFKKGKPGGPGRPKGSISVNSRCSQWADRYGFAFLEAIAEGKPCDKFHRADLELRVKVAQYLIDQGKGRPSQRIDMTSNGETVKFSLKMGPLPGDAGADA